MASILVELKAEVTTTDKTGGAAMAGTSHLGASSPFLAVNTTLFSSNYHIIVCSIRYVYSFVLFILAIRQTPYLANGSPI